MNPTPGQRPPFRVADPAWIAAARQAALAAVAFSLTVAAILIAVYRVDLRDDPLTSDRLTKLKVELLKRPTDEPLKQQIRQLDQTIREGHFRRRATLVRGGYLLLGGLGVFLFALTGDS